MLSHPRAIFIMILVATVIALLLLIFIGSWMMERSLHRPSKERKCISREKS